MKRTILLVATLSFLLVGFTTAQAQRTKVQQKEAAAINAEITALHAQLAESCSKADAAGIATLFTDDAQILSAEPSTARGQDDAKAFFQRAFQFGVRQVKLNLEDAGGEGNLAYESGSITLYDGQGKIIKEGRYMLLFKKVNDEWKIYRLISNSRTAKA